MFCKYCGTELATEARYCPSCGAPNWMPHTAPMTNYPVSATSPVHFGTYRPAAPSVSPTTILVFGILALALTQTMGVPGAIAGLVCAILAIVKSGRYAREVGTPVPLAKTGRILGFVGLGYSISMMVFYAVYFIFYFLVYFLAMLSASGGTAV